MKENEIEKIERIAKMLVSSPKVFEEGEFTFRFVSADITEALHVDAFGNDGSAKFWVKDEKYGLKNKPDSFWTNDSHLARNSGLKPEEINKVKKIIQNRKEEIVQQWEQAIQKSKRSGRQ